MGKNKLHLFPKETASTKRYTYPPRARDGLDVKVPSRIGRVEHGGLLVQQSQSAVRQFNDQLATKPEKSRPDGIVLTFRSDPDFKLKLDSLENRQQGCELLNSRIDDNNVMHATVFIPVGQVEKFIKKFEDYISEDTKKGNPQNQPLAESISEIRLAVLESFWTDASDFPAETDRTFWWEVWLRVTTGQKSNDVMDRFRERGHAVGITVGQREIGFPERRVVLVQATIDQLAAFENLFDMLAELRQAKTLTGEFLALSPRDQGEFIEDALTRITPPPVNAPAVCHLDAGVNRKHSLLKFALSKELCLSADPGWLPTDGHSEGHGTAMAGLALYGDLEAVLGKSDPVVLRHRLESVRIKHDAHPHEPDLYGEVTSQAISRAIIAAPDLQQRVVCLTVTTDETDKGTPSSWSGAVDQICAGVNGEATQSLPRQLLLVSAGNTPKEGQHNYPDHNHRHGPHDPAQSWNALTIGACTEKDTIYSNDYEDWRPIAEAGRLGPASPTSLQWDK